MNKKLLLVSTFILSFGILSAGQNAFANFEEYKIVGSAGSFDEKTVFGFDDSSPYIYMRLPENGQSFTGSFWRDPDATSFYTSTVGTTPDRNRWIKLADWDTIKKAGEWEVSSNYFYTTGETGFGIASFTVAPEPLAMVLFMVGGTPIAASLYRKRKKLLKV